MEKFSKHVGLDVHKDTIAVAIAAEDSEVRFYGEIANNPTAIIKLVKLLSKEGELVAFCYEAGGCGYKIYRQLTAMGKECIVVAPSLIPRKAGERVKTDRRDSINLARLYRAGELTPVWVPEDEQEALRDLTRAREDMKHFERQAKQRLLAFLLRHGWVYSGKARWTHAHYRWMETVKFDRQAQQIVFQEYKDIVNSFGTRVDEIESQMQIHAKESLSWPVIESLMSLRGVNFITAFTLIAEIGDLQRFASAPKLMAYLGLVPSERSSGNSVRRGGITKTGNSHVRRVLIEAAWTYRFAARRTPIIQRRMDKVPAAIQEISWSAQKRLCQRYKTLQTNGKLKVQVCTAVARELTGFIWAIGQATPIMKNTPTN